MSKSKQTESRKAEPQKRPQDDPSGILIDKIKVLSDGEGGKRQVILYHERGNKKMIESREPAAEAFYRTFDALGDDACDIMEFGEDYSVNVSTKTLNIKYEEGDNMKASITIRKDLSRSKGGSTISTPYKKVDIPTVIEDNEDEDPNQDVDNNEYTIHTRAARQRIRQMCFLAIGYLQGERDQLAFQ